MDALLTILAGALLAYVVFPHSQPMSEAAVLNAVGACELGGGIAVPQGMLTRPSDEAYVVHCLQRVKPRQSRENKPRGEWRSNRLSMAEPLLRRGK